jgi:thymidylate synthase (FAD)
VADEEVPMRRPSVPEADALIGLRHPVLSHGFVALVDYMGNDAAIVQAARVSYGQGTKTVHDDRGLIRYLMRHRHTTPFEMVEFKFLVRLPIYVARQWIRHRTACLAEGSRLSFDLPGGHGWSTRRHYPVRIEELYRKFQPTRNISAPSKQRNPYFRRDRVRGMLLRQVDEQTMAIRHTRIVDVVASGVKPTFRVTLDDGKSIDCTADHRFLFEDGWATLAGQTGLREVGGRAVWDAGDYYLRVNGAELAIPARYRDRAWLEAEYVGANRPLRDLAEACGVTPATIYRWVREFKLSRERPSSTPFTKGNTYYRLRKERHGPIKPRAYGGNRPGPYVQLEWLRARWVDRGMSASQIAAEAGASTHAIRAWLRNHGLTNHPQHPYVSPFYRGHTPWNRGRTYRLGPRPITATRLASIRAARSGPASNFWKGGISSDREGIGRWTTQIAHAIHERNHWTCQLCHRKDVVFHAHHIVPVWADLSLARDPSNLTTLCDACHKEVHVDETAYIHLLGGPAVTRPLVRIRRRDLNRLTVARLERLRSIEFLGLRPTYDVEVAGPHHNFVANGIITHNSVNEHSARYSVVPDEFEELQPGQVREQSKLNRQGRGDPLPTDVQEQFRADLARISQEAYGAYRRALDAGVARETARMVLPVAYYTQWYWKLNLHNLFHFLSLRLDPHAQDEIRLYAAELARLSRLVAPVAVEAFEEFQLGGLTFGRREQVALRALMDGKTPVEACAAAGLPLAREDGRPMKTGEGVEFVQKLERVRTLD